MRPRQRSLRPVRLVAALLAAALVASGCEYSGVHDMPLPGGVDVGDDSYTVEIEFADVLDLVPQSAVKVNDVTVGRVENVRLEGWHAVVTARVRGDVELPDNAVAQLRQTSLLGEKFVSLAPPSGEPRRGTLSDGDLVPLDATGRNPEVEEVLSALSLLLNGGGVQQIQTINQELAQVMQGREERIRSVLSRLDTFVGELEAHKHEIVRAIEGLDRLSARLERQRGTLEVALRDIPPGMKVLADQRRQLTRMLQALSRLGEVGTRVIEQSHANTVAGLRALVPILGKLAEAGHDLPRAMELLVTYPFPSTVRNAVRGDYTNLRVTADLDLQTILGNHDIPPQQQHEPPPSQPEQTPEPPELPLPDTPDPRDLVDRLCRDIPEETKLPDVCGKKELRLPRAELPYVVTGLCSLTPEEQRAKACPKRPEDADDDGRVDVCLPGLVCTDKDARTRQDVRDDRDEGTPGDADDVLCPPLCAAEPSPSARSDLTRLLLGGLS